MPLRRFGQAGQNLRRRFRMRRPWRLLASVSLLAVSALLLALAAAVLLSTGEAAGAAEHSLAPAQPAGTYPDADTRADDKVSIAVDPFDTATKADVFRVDYLKYGIIPMRIVITNDGDRAISLNDVRIHLMTPANDKIPASEPEDIERKVSTKDRVGTTVPLGPLKIHRQGKDSDSKIEQDFKEFEYSALAVEPHTTRAGFLFYDVSGLGKNPLKGARMVFREIRDADGKELFFFEVPFDKYLAAK